MRAQKRTCIQSAIFMLLALALITGSNATAWSAPNTQADPVAQCAEGVKLWRAHQDTQALPFLEAGFTGREHASFPDLSDLGNCAFGYAVLKHRAQDYDAALPAYLIALPFFQKAHNRRDESIVLSNLGTIYYARGRHDQALESYQQALAIVRELGNRKQEGEMLDSIGFIYEKLKQHDKALESYQQELIITRELGNRAGEGSTLSKIGDMYSAQKRYIQALESYQQVLAIVRSISDRDSEGVTLSNIGDMYFVQDRYTQALESYQQALVIMRERGNRLGEGATLGDIGFVYEKQDRYDQALESLQQALVIMRELGNRKQEGIRLSNIGFIYDQQGRHNQALESFQQALAISRELGDRAAESTRINNIASIYLDQGRYDLALESYQQALVIAQEVDDRAGAATTINNIGLIYGLQGRRGQLASYQQALTLSEEAGDRAGAANTLTNIGRIYMGQGRYDQALKSYDQALTIVRAIGDHAQESETLNHTGLLYAAQGHTDQALERYQQALVIAREVSDRSEEGHALGYIGQVYQKQGRYDQALEYYQQALVITRELGVRVEEGSLLGTLGSIYKAQHEYAKALNTYQQALSVLESVRATAGNEQGRASFIAQFGRLYDQAVSVSYQLSQPDQAFNISERGQARAFLDSLATGIVQISDQDVQALLADEQETYSIQQATRETLTRARAAQPSDQTLITDLEQQLATAIQQHDQVLATIAQRGDQLTALIPGRSNGVLDRAAVQALLDPQTTLVIYHVLDDQTLAFILTRDQFQTIALPITRNDLRIQVGALRQFANTDEAIPGSARQLYAELIAPLRPFITTPHLAIVPHDILHYLPFAALSDGRHAVLDDYTLTILPSASSLQFIKPNAPGTSATPLMLGNPITSDGNLRPLAQAEAEVQAIGQLYGATPLIGAQATIPALQAQAAQSRIVHLAAHGVYNSIDPLDSAILLAPGSDDDGRLTVRQVYGLDLHTSDLVVLSACETQIGERSAGDEVVGLTRAFFFAGAPSVIATLWSVDDQPTRLLMERFYTHLHAGMGKADALRQAQLDVRKQYPNPYYWAGFVLSGDGGTIATRLPWRDLSIIALAGLLMGGMTIFLLLAQRKSQR